MADMEATVQRLARWLEAHHGQYGQRSPGASEDAIAAVEHQLDVTFPDGLRALYRWSAGGHDDPTIMNNRQLMPLSKIVETRAMRLDLIKIGQFAEAWWDPQWVQFLTSPNGSGLCWNSGWGERARRGEVLEYWTNDGDRDVMAPGFDDWLNALVDSMEAGRWHYDDEAQLVKDDLGFKQYHLEQRRSRRPPTAARRPGTGRRASWTCRRRGALRARRR